ncbi:hypothetical protein KIN20_033699 [Parelaphostrongylus tenuis]|uniref:Uncharacterized protein n=1 Tax=Parelaphostrongylus tenuis TaxID=148309 RepID=A0AAD5R8I8_PARTN|nr:hypothetical protein KIN20_033699 [Parelaphostrongylus tenuis]
MSDLTSLVGSWKDATVDNIDEEYDRLVEYLHADDTPHPALLRLAELSLVDEIPRAALEDAEIVTRLRHMVGAVMAIKIVSSSETTFTPNFLPRCDDAEVQSLSKGQSTNTGDKQEPQAREFQFRAVAAVLQGRNQKEEPIQTVSVFNLHERPSRCK